MDISAVKREMNLLFGEWISCKRGSISVLVGKKEFCGYHMF